MVTTAGEDAFAGCGWLASCAAFRNKPTIMSLEASGCVAIETWDCVLGHIFDARD